MTTVQRAVLEAVLIGSTGGLISVHIVLRRLSFFTLAMTHGTFPGVILAAIAGLDLYLGGGAFGALVVLGVVALSRRPGQNPSTAIGIVLSAGFALGVVLLSARDGFSKDLAAYTVGQILTVDQGDLLAAASVLVAVILLLAVAGRQLIFRAFDPEGYGAAGFRSGLLDVVFLLVVEAVIVVAVPAVGTILAVALLVGPAATARLWTHRIGPMTALAVTIGAGSGLIGMLGSARYDVAAGGAITMVTGVTFAVSLTVVSLRRANRTPPARPGAHLDGIG